MQLPVSCRQCVMPHIMAVVLPPSCCKRLHTSHHSFLSPRGNVRHPVALLPTPCGLQQQLLTVETWQIRSVTHDASLKQSELPGIRRHLSISISLTSLFEPTASYLYREGLGSCRTAWLVALPPSFHKSLYTASAHRSRQGLPFRP
jgi:hypothetical protein